MYKVLNLFNKGNNKDFKWTHDFASVLQKPLQRLIAEPRSFLCHFPSLGWVIFFSKSGKAWENPSCCNQNKFHPHQRSTEDRAFLNFLFEQKELFSTLWPWRSAYCLPLCINFFGLFGGWNISICIFIWHALLLLWIPKRLPSFFISGWLFFPKIHLSHPTRICKMPRAIHPSGQVTGIISSERATRAGAPSSPLPFQHLFSHSSLPARIFTFLNREKPGWKR